MIMARVRAWLGVGKNAETNRLDLDWTSDRLSALTPDDRVNRARQAAALLENPILAECLEVIEADLTRRWKRETDGAERDRLWSDVRSTEHLRDAIRAIANTAHLISKRAS